MYSFIFCYIFALLSTPSSSRSLYSDSSREDPTGAHVDLQGVGNAAQILNILQQLSEQSSKIQLPQNWRGNNEKGIDADYLGFSGEQHLDANRLMELVQRNYEANRENAWKRSEVNPRVYYISNPEVLEEYWKTLKKKESSESSDGDDRSQRGAGVDANLLKYIISLRREGDDMDAGDEENLEDNRLDNNDNDNLDQDFRGTMPLEEATKVNSYENTETTLNYDFPKRSGLRTVGFKSHDDYETNDKARSGKKGKSKFDYRIPAKVERDDEDIKKSIETFKSAWKMKGGNSHRSRNVDAEEIKSKPRPEAYSRPRVTIKERLRSNKVASNIGYSYGRTPVPVVGKRGIYEDD